MLRRTMLKGIAGLALAAPLVASCASGKGSGGKSPAARSDIAALLPRMKEFNRLTEYVRLAGLEDDLAGAGPFTLFAPDDAAFGAVINNAGGGISGTGNRLNFNQLRRPENKAKLVRLIKHHLVAGRLDALAVQRAKTLRTLAGTDLLVTRQGQRVEIGTADVVRTNIGASNGYIHVIDAVLVPPQT